MDLIRHVTHIEEMSYKIKAGIGDGVQILLF